jgi:hypothetical protein
MLIKKFNLFLDNFRVVENVQAAKAYMRKKAIEKIKSENPEATITIADFDKKTPSETVMKAKSLSDENSDYLRIKDLVKDNPGMTFAFVKFFFEEGISYADLSLLYTRLQENKQFLNQLPHEFNFYGNVVPDLSDRRNGYEMLLDDLTQIDINRAVARWISQLPGEFVVKNPDAKDKGAIIPSFRQACKTASEAQKKKIQELALAFDELGWDKESKKALQNQFFVRCYRDRNLNQVINAAYSYIDSVSNKSVADLLIKIDESVKKYGISNGAEVVYNKDNIVIFEVKSFQANVLINSSTKHCIKDSYGSWKYYLGESNRQYYVWDFNQSPASQRFIFAVTIEPDGSIRAAHWKDDGTIDNVKWYVKLKLGINFSDYFVPLSEEEIRHRNRKKIADQALSSANLTLQSAKKAIEDGGDVNIGEGLPLKNAVKKDDIELVKYLIEQGARASIGDAISHVKSFDILLLLLQAGATINDAILDNLITDARAVKLLIDNGLDPNQNNGHPVIKAIEKGAKETIKVLIQNGGEFLPWRRGRAIGLAAQSGDMEILKMVFDHIIKKGQKISANYAEEIIEDYDYPEEFKTYLEEQIISLID